MASQQSNEGNTFLIDVEALLGVPGINRRLVVDSLLCVVIDISSIKRSRKKGSFQLLLGSFGRFFVLKDTRAEPVLDAAPVLRGIVRVGLQAKRDRFDAATVGDR